MKPTSIISESFHFFSVNATQIALASLPIVAAAYALQLIVTSSVDSPYATILSSVVGLLTYPLYTAATILAIAKRTKGEGVNFYTTFRAALKHWWPLSLLLSALAVTISLGLILLIVPGIWLGARLSLSEIYVVLAETKPIDALKMSFRTTRPQFNSILVTLILVAIPMGLLSLGMDILFKAIGNNYPLAFVVGVVGMFIGLFTNVVLFRMFMLTASDKEA